MKKFRLTLLDWASKALNFAARMIGDINVSVREAHHAIEHEDRLKWEATVLELPHLWELVGGTEYYQSDLSRAVQNKHPRAQRIEQFTDAGHFIRWFVELTPVAEAVPVGEGRRNWRLWVRA